MDAVVLGRGFRRMGERRGAEETGGEEGTYVALWRALLLEDPPPAMVKVCLWEDGERGWLNDVVVGGDDCEVAL